MCHEWRRAIEQRCIIEHQAVFRSDKCWQHGEVGSENVNWGYRMTNWQNGWTTAPELNLLLCSALLYSVVAGSSS